ncbi:hypothetical protein [Aquimarina sp. AU119]|uniref:hypothetical protein n=1 Tax=Aquimarina sp. AU119 TaxID=2108528 RepID=UPI000D68D8E6|nr:hypothetical protein [Aquimarina sp. AU119]
MTNTKINWYHTIVATDDNKVISVTNRNFEEKAAGFLHNFLEVPLNTQQNRAVTNTKAFTETELCNVLELFRDYQQYKEIEFLKVCIGYLRSNKNVEKLTFTFHNN